MVFNSRAHRQLHVFLGLQEVRLQASADHSDPYLPVVSDSDDLFDPFFGHDLCKVIAHPPH